MLTEQYRPRTWAEVVGQEKIVQRIQALAKRGLAGRAYWLSGGSGQGKTTIARLVAAEVAEALFTRELDAAALTVSELQELEREMHICGGGDKGGRAFIVNEAHALRKPVIRQLLVLLERIPAHVAIIFTTTEGQELSTPKARTQARAWEWPRGRTGDDLSPD
jgi:DNA polymerase III subunit gamma/tau